MTFVERANATKLVRDAMARAHRATIHGNRVPSDATAAAIARVIVILDHDIGVSADDLLKVASVLSRYVESEG